MAAALALGIALLMLSSFFSADRGKTADRQETGTDVGALQYAQTEKHLKAAVEKVRGISDVTVFITYENSGVKKRRPTATQAPPCRRGQRPPQARTIPL